MRPAAKQPAGPSGAARAGGPSNRSVPGKHAGGTRQDVVKQAQQGGASAEKGKRLREGSRHLPGQAAVRLGRQGSSIRRGTSRGHCQRHLHLETMLWVVAESRPVEISSAKSTRLAPTSISPAVTRFFCLHDRGGGCEQPGNCAPAPAFLQAGAHPACRLACIDGRLLRCASTEGVHVADASTHPPEMPRSMPLPTCKAEGQRAKWPGAVRHKQATQCRLHTALRLPLEGLGRLGLRRSKRGGSRRHACSLSGLFTCQRVGAHI